MIWTSIWSRLIGRTRPAPARRASSQAKLAVESLEDRVVPSLTYAQWQQQTFRVDDMIVSNLAQAVPTNASFGSMIGLPSAFTNTPYRGGGYSVAVIDTGIDYRNPALGGG